MTTVLIDADVSFARKWFGGSTADPKWSDPQVVQRAWRGDLTIVTANGQDFVRYILAHQRSYPCTKRACHDMSGLIVLPNHELKAKIAVETVSRRSGLRAGGELIQIEDIWDYNLYVKYHLDGTTEIKRFPLCRYREDVSSLPRWYEPLAVIGAG